MEKIKFYFTQPYAEKGVFKASLDLLLRALTVWVWVWLMRVIGLLVWDALLHQYDPMLKMWWLAYSFILFFGGSWLAYILLFVRDYYTAD